MFHIFLSCVVCGTSLRDDETCYELYKKKVGAYSDCMKETIVCSSTCLRKLVEDPTEYLEFQNE